MNFAVELILAQPLPWILISGDQQSFGLPCATPDKHRVDVAFLDQHANQQWEAILHYMVGTSMTKRPSTGVLKLLQCSELMKARSARYTLPRRTRTKDHEQGVSILASGRQYPSMGIPAAVSRHDRGM
ncbi:transcription factor Tfb2-domain-containing protein [Endogone sp. FLAS-F59071]|nr:transcription factor Tfb2-domain-containing protein [Endogone sp. FLAS-F59071]|eukprot:RUS15782.1 transcription factor Tfb2-domain-containing protein [Endogone sp. FLAS-F59071]